MLTVVAQIAAKPGQEAPLETALRDLLGPTRAEPGCHRYDLHRDQDAPGRFVMLEEWSGIAALEAHRTTAHIQAFRARLGELVADFTVTKLDRVA